MRNNVKQLQVNVNDDITKKVLMKQFSAGLEVGKTKVPITIVNSGVPTTHAGGDGQICNSSGFNGFGSLGCILEWKEAQTQHILSCWHVLKGNMNYGSPDANRIIKEKNSNQELGERWAGGIKDQYDYGLAECNPGIVYLNNSLLKRKLNIQKQSIAFREISKADVTKQIAIQYYNALHDSITPGIIFSESKNVEIDYLDHTRNMQDILILTQSKNNETTISQGGNSGSVVFDMNQNAIAMIIGGDRNYTYAIKLSHIFKIHSEMTIA